MSGAKRDAARPAAGEAGSGHAPAAAARRTWIARLGSSAPLGGAPRSALAVALAAAALLASGLGGSGGPRALRYPDAFDYAQMGRQLARGEGFSSLQTFPYVLGWLDARGYDTAPPWPVLWRFPLPVVTRAGAFALLGEDDAAALAPGLAFAAATAAALFLLGNRLGGASAGVLAAGLWVAAPSQRAVAAAGLSEPGAALLAVASLHAALWLSDALPCAPGARARAPARGRALLLGALLGLAWLQRSNLLALAPGIGVLLVLRHRRAAVRPLASVAAAALGVAAPWLLRNALHFGSPLLDLTRDRGLLRLALGNDPFLRLEQHDVRALALGAIGRFAAGWQPQWLLERGWRPFGADLAWLLPLALVLLGFELRDRLRARSGAAPHDAPARRARDRAALPALALAAFAITALVFVPIYPHVDRFYWPWAPALLAFVAAATLTRIDALMAARPRLRRAAAAWPAARLAFALAAAGSFALGAPRGGATPLLAGGAPSQPLRSLAARLAPRAHVAADRSYASAWRAGLASVRMPREPGALARLHERVLRIDAVVALPGDPSYAPLLRQEAIGPLRRQPWPHGVLFAAPDALRAAGPAQRSISSSRSASSRRAS